MKTNNIEEQLRLIDEFFEETPQKVIDKMFQEAKAANPDDVSFEEYCGYLEEVLDESMVIMEELPTPTVLALVPIPTISGVGNRGKYDDIASYCNDETETIKAA